jgi:hypothetical protein
MSFTIAQAKALAESLIDEDIEDADALLWGKECLQNKIGSHAWAEDVTEYDATANKWYSLPSDFWRVVGVSKSIGSPEDLAITIAGSSGAVTYGYRVSALNYNGESLACTEVTVTTGNAVLSSSNYNSLNWSDLTGATGYNVYRTTCGSTSHVIGLIGDNKTTSTLDDNGIVADANQAVPTDDSTDSEYSNYTIRNRKIRFEDGNIYVLVYTVYPAVTSVSESLTILDAYMYPIAAFIASRYRSKDDSDDADAARWMAECEHNIAYILDEAELNNTALQVVESW